MFEPKVCSPWCKSVTGNVTTDEFINMTCVMVEMTGEREKDPPHQSSPTLQQQVIVASPDLSALGPCIA